MPSTWTVSGRFTLQATGENYNTWGGILNNQTIQLIDNAIAGMASFTLSGAKTLTTVNGAPDEARMATLNVTGGTGGTITIPAVPKLYVVRNAAINPVVLTTGATGGATNATVQPGEIAQVATDGASVWRVRSTMFDGATLKGLGAPGADTDAATKLYVDQAISGVAAGGLPPAAGKQGQFIGNNGATPLWTDTSALIWNLAGLRLGGVTNAFPMWKQAGATLAARLADDSGDTLVTGATAPLFDVTNKLASMFAVQRALGNLSNIDGIGANTVLTTGDLGRLKVIFGAYTVTLPSLAGLPYGTAVWLYNESMSVATVQGAGSDKLYAGTQSGLSSLSIPAGSWVVLVSGASWYAYGSATLIYDTVMQGAGFFTQPAFDASTKLATDAFVQRALGNRSSYTSTTTDLQLDITHSGRIIIPYSSSVIGIWMPASAACYVGQTFHIFNWGTASVNLNCNGADTFLVGASASYSTITIPSGSFVTIVFGAGKFNTYGTGVLKYEGQFSSSNGTYGYQRFPGGQVWQWGSTVAHATPGNGMSITFPVTFPTGLKSATISGLNQSGQSLAWIYQTNPSTMAFVSNVGSLICGWNAIGY